MTMSHSTNAAIIGIKSWCVQRNPSPGGSTESAVGRRRKKGDIAVCVSCVRFKWNLPLVALLLGMNRTKKNKTHFECASKWD